MNNLSLVDPNQLQKDPRKLAFKFPKMPVIRYKELTEIFHRSLTIIAVEKVVKMLGCVLMPAPCVHHDRRRADRRLMIHGRTYYVIEIDEVTDLEWAKYQARCRYIL